MDGIDFAVEVPKVKGGGLLWSILDHFDLKVIHFALMKALLYCPHLKLVHR